MGYCPFELEHWVTIQSLYRDTRASLAWGRLKLYCNRVLYCNRKASLAWVKVVSRYNYCIVTEAAGMVLERFVSQYTQFIVTGATEWLEEECIAIHGLYCDREVGWLREKLCRDTSHCIVTAGN